MKHLPHIVSWVMMLFSSIVTFAQTPFDAFSPETSRPILDGDSIAAWRAEQQPDTFICAIVADLRNEQLLLVDVMTSSILAYAPFTDEAKNWFSVDPLADKYIHQSPYLYCGGNPIMLVDPDGRRLLNIDGENTSDLEIWKNICAGYNYRKSELQRRFDNSSSPLEKKRVQHQIDDITNALAELQYIFDTPDYTFSFAITDGYFGTVELKEGVILIAVSIFIPEDILPLYGHESSHAYDIVQKLNALWGKSLDYWDSAKKAAITRDGEKKAYRRQFLLDNLSMPRNVLNLASGETLTYEKINDYYIRQIKKPNTKESYEYRTLPRR